MEQVCNFKLTRLEACAMGSPIGKMDGWPGSPADEQEPVKVQKGPSGKGQEAPEVEGCRQEEAFCVLKVCLLSANPSYGHLPRGASAAVDAALPIVPSPDTGIERNPKGRPPKYRPG